MNREFVETPLFMRAWEEMDLSDDDLLRLQGQLMKNPSAGPVIPDSGGARKVRVQLPDRGKSGGCRVIYVDFAVYKKLYLVFAYPKAEMANLDKNQISGYKKFIHVLEKELSENERGETKRH